MGYLSDNIIPEIWQENLAIDVAEEAKIFNTPMVKKDNNFHNGTAAIVKAPFMLEPNNISEQPQEDVRVTAHKVGQELDQMIRITRTTSWRYSETTTRYFDPGWGQKLYQYTATWLAKEYERLAVGILKAIFGPGGTLYSTHTVDVNTPLDFPIVSRGKQLLGDVRSDLSVTVANSAVIGALQLLGLANEMVVPNWKERIINQGELPILMGMPIVETDLLQPVVIGGTTKYLTFFSGNEPTVFCNSFIKIQTEYDSTFNGGDERLVVIFDFCFHVPGVKYALDNVLTPTDAQLFDPATWVRVADHNKKIKLIALFTPIE